MVDFILLCFFIGTFLAGVWCGATYGSFKTLYQRAKVWVKAKL